VTNLHTTDYTLCSVYLYLTGGCNLACAHCWLSPDYVPSGVDAPEGITLRDVERIIEGAKPMGLTSMKLTGGEPFLNREVLEIIELIDSHGLSMIIETNGTLIDNDVADHIAGRNIDTVSVSLESHQSSFHDDFRGVAGAFEDAVRGIELLVSRDINTQVIMTLVEGNKNDIEGVIALARRLGVGSVKVNPVMPVGRGDTLTRQGGAVPVAQMVGMSRWVDEELSRMYSVDTFFSLPTAFKSITKIMDRKNAECSILNILGVVATGHISICGIGRMEPDLVMGDIRTDDIARVWNESPILADLRKAVPERLEGICGKCVLKGVCLGACRANAYVMSGNLMAPYWICQEAYEDGIFPETRIVQ